MDSTLAQLHIVLLVSRPRDEVKQGVRAPEMNTVIPIRVIIYP